MKLIATTITETAVRMRFADAEDETRATKWIDFQVPLDGLKLPSDTGLGDPETHFLATVRQAALRYARDIIGDETRRLASLRDQMRG